MKTESSEQNMLESQISRVRKKPSFTGMLELVRAIDDCVTRSGSVKGAEVTKDAKLATVRHKVFREAFDICFAASKNKPRHAAQAIRGYVVSMRSSRPRSPSLGPTLGSSEPTLSSSAGEAYTDDVLVSEEYLATYHLAVAIQMAEHDSANEGRHILDWLMGCLKLSFEDLGKMFHVTGETVRRWKTGAHPIPSERKAEITSAGSALEKLLKMFRFERLPETMRRPAKLFEGKSALDWILQGRIAEVADRYEVLLRYQA